MFIGNETTTSKAERKFHHYNIAVYDLLGDNNFFVTKRFFLHTLFTVVNLLSPTIPRLTTSDATTSVV